MTEEQPASTIIDWAVFKEENAASAASQKAEAYTGKNKRRTQRYSIDAQVNVWLDSGVMLEGAARDISTKGVWFECGSSLPLGNPVRVDVVARKRGGAALAAKITGSVVRISEGGLAVAFDELDHGQHDAVEALIAHAATGEV